MTDPGGPAPGEMQLYDAVVPPLKNDTYKLSVSTSVTGGNFPLAPRDSYFAIEGPRFALAASEVSSVHPPRNAVGFFEEVLPHVVLGRRTLPWERDLDPAGLIPAPPPDPDEPEPRPLQGRPPWLALLVFADDPEAPEAKVLTQVPLSTVITDGAVLARLNPGGDPLVDAVEAPGPLLRRLLPTKDEATLLCHARRVNVDDRELAAGDSDGWFAVVMANRLPAPGHRHRACLVSLEQRTDLVPSIPWRTGDAVPAAPATARLVLLHSWTFTAAPARPGGGSFRELAVGLDSGLIGTGTPGITDTGHVPVTLHDRTGSELDAWYRGPLCPRPVARGRARPLPQRRPGAEGQPGDGPGGHLLLGSVRARPPARRGRPAPRTGADAMAAGGLPASGALERRDDGLGQRPGRWCPMPPTACDKGWSRRWRSRCSSVPARARARRPTSRGSRPRARRRGWTRNGSRAPGG